MLGGGGELKRLLDICLPVLKLGENDVSEQTDVVGRLMGDPIYSTWTPLINLPRFPEKLNARNHCCYIRF